MKSSIWKSVEDFLIRYRIPFSLLIVSSLLYSDWRHKHIPNNILDFANPLSLLAIALVVAGVALRSWAAGVIRKTKSLATTGPYALTRHPLYVGSFLLASGFSIVLWDSAKLLVLLAVAALFYIPKIRREEVHLAQQFKEEWTRYCENTGRFFPKKKPALETTWSWSQWNYNREYNAVIATLMLLMALASFGKAVGPSLS